MQQLIGAAMENRSMREKIFDNYIQKKTDIRADANHFIPNDRNLEGYEMMFLKFMPEDKDARILDIGCGCGQLLYMLREKGYNNIKGIDIGNAQVGLTKKLGICAEKIDDLIAYLGKNGGLDVIIMSQVIEHFSKDRVYQYLEAMKTALRPGGRIIIATPNMALLSGTFQRYIDFTHELGFTERSLGEVLRVTGFKDIEIYGDTLSFKPRPKFIMWLVLRTIWFKILGFLYLLERGSERPRIISRHLIAVAKNTD